VVKIVFDMVSDSLKNINILVSTDK
jgi:hypothetical protein